MQSRLIGLVFLCSAMNIMELSLKFGGWVMR